MTLDVVVVTYQSAGLLPRALSGLPAHARVIVVDNASLDGSAEVARDLGAEVHVNPVNAGFGAAANQGVALGRSEFVLLLNPDAVVDAETVQELCGRLVSDPHLAVVSPRLTDATGAEQRVAWPYPSAGGAWREALGLHRLRAGRRAERFVIGACFLVRRSAFEALGGFDTRFWLYSEEADLCRRAQLGGWGVELQDDLWAEHVGGASGTGTEAIVFEHFERGGEHFVAKHAGRGALVSYRLANLVGASLRAALPGSPRRRALHRARARRELALLARRPSSVELASPASSARGVGLVVCSLEPWDDVWRRNQFLVRELLRLDPHRRVLWVEPSYDWVHELRRRSGRRRRRGLRPVEGEGRVVRLETGKWWPGALGGRAGASLRRQVRAASDELGFVQPELWVNDSRYAGLATATGWPSTYDITDDWTQSGDGGRATRRVRREEAQLLEECRSVVVCSEELAQTRRRTRPDLCVIPNAVDVGHFQRPRSRPADLPPGPVALYLGTLHDDRLDVDLIEQLARTSSTTAVALVGPSSLSERSEQRLAALPNVHLMGARRYADVPAYLQHADVVIVPHVVTPFTESLDPIKAYECLAVGRPTVATPVAGFRGLGDPVRTATGRRFIDEVLSMLSAGPSASRPRAVPSWADRALAFRAELGRSAAPAVRSGAART